MTRIVIKMLVVTLETLRFQRTNIGQFGIPLALFTGERYWVAGRKV